VEKASLSHDGTAILYAHNIGDLPGRHVSSVRLSGGAPAALADMGTNQWAPTGLAGGAVAFVDAGWTKTQTVHFRSADGATTDVGPAAPQGYPRHLFVKPTAVQFSATDGELTYGELFTPKRPTGCGIVFIHGGKERQMLLGFHYMDVYSYLYVFNQYLASRGCAVLSLEYRGSLMRGTAYRNAAGYGTSAKVSEYADFLGAAAYLRSRPELKVKRVGVYGISQGGFSTAISLGRNSDVFSVGFDMAGVHDYPAGVPESLLSSYVDTWASPILIASGDDDRTVDHGQSMLLYSELMRRKPSFEVAGRVYPNETHDLYQSIANLTDLYWDGGEFMMKHLVK
jgi:dipeptidyl aminopeptidase/acylaminoacyl peptidase